MCTAAEKSGRKKTQKERKKDKKIEGEADFSLASTDRVDMHPKSSAPKSRKLKLTAV